MWVVLTMIGGIWFGDAGEPPEVEASPVVPPHVRSICVSCRLEPKPAIEAYTDPQWNRLRDGAILTSDRAEDTEGKVVASAVIEQTPDHVWTVLTDFERWPEFMPHIRETIVERDVGTRRWVRQHYRILFRNLQHTTIYEFEPAQGRLAWTLDLESEHDIAASQGQWQLVRLDGGWGTLVQYQARMDAGRNLPGFVQDLLMRRSLNDLLTHLREEVIERYGHVPSIRAPVDDEAAPPATDR